MGASRLSDQSDRVFILGVETSRPNMEPRLLGETWMRSNLQPNCTAAKEKISVMKHLYTVLLPLYPVSD
jgi:hypothetical protein